jgi:hypothetical protein
MQQLTVNFYVTVSDLIDFSETLMLNFFAEPAVLFHIAFNYVIYLRCVC